jgi:hypothetical protein
MARIAQRAAVLAASVVLTACGSLLPSTSSTDDVRECPLIGCESQITFALDYNLPAGTIMVGEDVEFERTQPNGPGCEPVCWIATIPIL